MKMEIKGRKIGYEETPLIIAEIGINHNGDLNTAKKMVQCAVKSGCEVIKHQTHFVHDEMTPEAQEIYPPNANSSIWDVMERCSLSRDDEIELKEYTEHLGAIYISTPFSRSAAEFLNEINVPAFKIGSGECTHLPLIRQIANYGKPVIMSTGMQPVENIKKSVKILEESGVPFALLECTNLYPSPPESVSLNGIKELRREFPRSIVGFSDHSIGPYMALAAVALGASIIERHFTDTRYRKGPDVTCSMDPAELRLLIDRSKEIHLAVRNTKKRTVEEEKVYRFARGSVVADKPMEKGYVIKEDDIWARRPGTGEIGVESFYDVVGKRLVNNVKFNQQLKWSDISD